VPQFRCNFCNGTGSIGLAKCRSCEGRGWYERPVSIVGRRETIFVALLSLSFGIIGLVLHVWSTLFNGFALAFFGLVIVFLAIQLRGPKEKGWNGLMLLGSLVTAIGLLSVPILAVWHVIK